MEPQFEKPPIPSAEKPKEIYQIEQIDNTQCLISELREKVRAQNFEAPESITEQRRKELKEEINNVANIFERAQRPWFLGGGAALELHINEFQRNHWDQDVFIYPEDRKTFIEPIRESGYDFFVPYSGKKDSLATDEQVIAERNFHLNKINERALGPKFIDLYILDREGNSGNIIWDENVILPKSLFENTPKYTSDNGKEIPLVPKEALILHKILGERQLDFDDLKRSLPTVTAEERERLDVYLRGSRISFTVAGRETQNLDELMRLVEAATKDTKENFLIPEVEKALFQKSKKYNADTLKTLEHQLKIKAWDMPRWEVRHSTS